MHAPTTWHRHSRSHYWATVNNDAPELDLYREYLHSPVLDAGCGTGRLLALLCGKGLEVDGCDASPDMIERCRRRVPDATLWVSRLHELSPPRRYRSIVCSGVLGLGSTREQDIQALHRLHDALLPGGVLVLDNEERPFRWGVRDWSEPVDRFDLAVHPGRCGRRGRPLRPYDHPRGNKRRTIRGTRTDDAAVVPR